MRDVRHVMVDGGSFPSWERHFFGGQKKNTAYGTLHFNSAFIRST